jgi:AsmA protein
VASRRREIHSDEHHIAGFAGGEETRVKRMIRFVAIAAAVVCLGVAALAMFVNANQFRPMLTARLSSALGRPVQIGDLKLAVFSGGVTATGLSVGDDPAFSRAPFLEAKTLAVGVELLPLLFSHRVNVTGVRIEQPRILLMQAADGRWNFSSIGARAGANAATAEQPAHSSSFALSLKSIRLSDGQITIAGLSANGRPQVYNDVNIDADNFSATAAFPFSLSAKMAAVGEAKLEGTAGPINASDAARTPFRTRVAVKHFDLVAGGFVKPATGFAGLLSLDGSAASDGSTLQSEGKIRGERMKLARNGTPADKPIQFDFSADQDLGKGAGTLRRGEIHIGAARARLSGRWTVRGDSTSLAMQLTGHAMPIPELESMLPALGIVLPMGSSLEGGAADAVVSVQGPAEALVISGNVGLSHTKLAGYDLGSRISTIARLAGIRAGSDTDIESFTAVVRVAPEGTTVESLTLSAPSLGDLNGAGTVSPAHALAFRMLARLHTSGLMVLGQRGELGVPFAVTGTSSSPVFAPDVKGIAASEAKALLKSNEVSQGAQKVFQGLFGKKKTQ